jgi:hypothetical protein
MHADLVPTDAIFAIFNRRKADSGVKSVTNDSRAATAVALQFTDPLDR